MSFFGYFVDDNFLSLTVFLFQAKPAYVLLLLHEAPARSRFDRCFDRVWQLICSGTVDRKVLIASHSVELCSVQEVQRVLKI